MTFCLKIAESSSHNYDINWLKEVLWVTKLISEHLIKNTGRFNELIINLGNNELFNNLLNLDSYSIIYTVKEHNIAIWYPKFW